MKKIGFIGAGNMATAIIGGIVKQGIEASISAYDLDKEKLAFLQKEYHVISAASIEAILQSNYVVLAVKPQNFPDVLSEMKPIISHDTVIISIAAGITPEKISGNLGYSAKVIRVMPNTPLLLGYGASALCRSDIVSDEEFAFAQEIFNSAGVSAIVPKDKMNEIIAINGSSPAFIYEFSRCFIEYGKGVGLDETVCLSLFAQTLIGSAKMMIESGFSIDELITMVSSKGGTTIAGLESFRESNLPNVVQKACESCVNRAYELAK